MYINNIRRASLQRVRGGRNNNNDHSNTDDNFLQAQAYASLCSPLLTSVNPHVTDEEPEAQR